MSTWGWVATWGGAVLFSAWSAPLFALVFSAAAVHLCIRALTRHRSLAADALVGLGAGGVAAFAVFALTGNGVDPLAAIALGYAAVAMYRARDNGRGNHA